MKIQSSNLHRSDISGLRAVAVLSIVLFHLEESWVPGGFIGVDIFFVISGFLITGLVWRDLQAGTFSFAEFYVRRVRRLVPALSLVVLVTLAVGHLVLLPDDLLRLSGMAVAAQLSMANVYATFFIETGYFASDTAQEPLLHLWSLGVEEQFYLIWPLTLLGLHKVSARLRIAIAVLIVVGSFVFAQWVFHYHSAFAYYMLPSRAGELVIGALSFFAARRLRVGALGLQIMALVGSLAIGASLVLLSSKVQFPGFSALPVTLGTALVLIAGSSGQSTVVSTVLSVRPMTWIGEISYSMYLWHWPVLAYLRYLNADDGHVAKAASFLAIVALSWVTYQFIETPFRTQRSNIRVTLAKLFAAPTLLILLMAAFAAMTSGLGIMYVRPGYAAEIDRALQQTAANYHSPHVCQIFVVTAKDMSDDRCVSGRSGSEEPTLLLWGDSHAGHYVGMLRELLSETGIAFRNIAHAACPPFLDQPERFALAKYRKDCSETARVIQPYLGRYKTLVIAAKWSIYRSRVTDAFDGAFSETVAQLRAAGHNVIVLGELPALPHYDRKCHAKKLKLPFLDCLSSATSDRAGSEARNAHVRSLVEANGGTYLDFNEVLCRDRICSGVLGDTPIYYDSNHLSFAGSVALGERAKAQGLQKLLVGRF